MTGDTTTVTGAGAGPGAATDVPQSLALRAVRQARTDGCGETADVDDAVRALRLALHAARIELPGTCRPTAAPAATWRQVHSSNWAASARTWPSHWPR